MSVHRPLSLSLATAALLLLGACGAASPATPAAPAPSGPSTPSPSTAAASTTAASTTAVSTAVSAESGAAAVTAAVTVQSCGVEYTYPRPPERVLLGAPGVIRTLDALGVADAAVGYALSDYSVPGLDTFPRLTAITADYAPSREFLVSTRPDLFLANDEGQLTGEGTASLADLATAGGNLYVLGGYCAAQPAPATLDAVYQDITELGAIFRVPEKASTLVGQLRERVATSRALNTSGRTPTAVVATLYDGKVYALSGSYYGAVLDALGVRNAFGDLGANFAEISREQILTTEADVIFVTHGGEDSAAAVAEATSVFAGTAAVRDNQVFGMPETAFQSGGVAVIDVVDSAARQLFANGA